MPTRLIAVLGLLIVCRPAFSQSRSEEGLYESLMKGPDSVKALETVLSKADEFSTLVLYVGARTALKEGRLEDAAFLFYAAQLRARFDQECFPPSAKGEGNPFAAYAPVSQALGRVINPLAMSKPEVFAKALARVQKWTPKASKEYDPGYEFTERKTELEAQKAAQPNRTEFISRMTDLSSLLNDEEYFSAFQVVQAFNLGAADKRPKKEAFDKAADTMKRIEKNKGLKGVFSK